MRVGCCGFPVSRSTYYGTFRCVEVQQTFYQPPREDTLRKWRSEAPEGFEFTIKAWQLITHEPKSPTYRRLKLKIPEDRKDRYGAFKPTGEVLEAWEVTRLSAQALGARIIIFQTPLSFKPTEDALRNIRAFFGRIRRDGFILGWEPRGWPGEVVRSICEELDLVHVVDPFSDEATWGGIVYWRLHGKGGYNYRYSQQELEELRGRIEGDRPHYVMFNNTNMFEDARRFLRLLEDG